MPTANEFDIDVLVLQETHTALEEELISRGSINGYYLIDFLLSGVYGTATYIKSSISNFERVFSRVISNIDVVVVKVSGIFIINIYKPPNVHWPPDFEVLLPHPAIYVGDFNCHHVMWQYDDNDANGISLYEWMEQNNLYLIFDAKSIKTFRSARWKKDYNPDLCIVSMDDDFQPLKTARKVLSGFPHSQHRPSVLTIGTEIPIVNSIPKPRWNFQKANWLKFATIVDNNLRRIAPVHENYDIFVSAVKNAAKRSIPRGFQKTYIPGWSKETNIRYKNYQKDPSQQNANLILKSLNGARKEKWNKLMENMNFTHSSRSSWALLNKLDTANSRTEKYSEISPNAIASRLVKVSNIVEISETSMKKMKRLLRKQRKETAVDPEIGNVFNLEELKAATYLTKTRKAAGFDGIYPEFFKHFGVFALNWLVLFYNDILLTGLLPREFKQAKVIAILKPGRPPDNAANYRPISLLSVAFKVLKRMLYQRISPIIESVLPKEQGGFRPGRSCCDQVLALSTHIEAGFQRKLKTGAAFLDLTSAYDTVWKDGLIHKLYNVIPCKRVVSLVENMLSNRKLRVFVGDKSSKFKYLNNGLPQGSVLSPLLFNVYTSDLPETTSRKFIYADDLALTFQHSSFDQLETTLNRDIQIMVQYFRNWRLCPNPNKSEVSCFHLYNREKDKELHVMMEETRLNHSFSPVYLGVTLDTSLTFKLHIEKLRKKLKTRNNILHKLAGSDWGTHADTLRTAGVSLVYSAAEYCCPVWLGSSHTKKVDVELNTTMRIISGTLKSTPTEWLPVLSNITPPHIRRQEACKREYKKYTSDYPIWEDIQNIPPTRLKSRSPFWQYPFLEHESSSIDTWKSEWSNVEVHNKQLALDPTEKVPGFDLPRKLWCKLNRVRTGHGRCNAMLFKWNAIESPDCEYCPGVPETMMHLVEECPTCRCPVGLDIHNTYPEAMEW